jgi:hypothetical protein
MKKLIFLLVLLTTASYGADYHTPYDPGAARNTLSNVTPATGRAALGLGTMAVATSTDYVATSALALRLDTTNASISENLDVTGDVGAATVNGVAPLTAAEKTQALVGSSTVDFAAADIGASGFTGLGDLSTPIKMLVVASSTASTEGGDSRVLHGLTGAKIIFATALVFHATNAAVPPGYTAEAEYEYNFEFNDTHVIVTNTTTNSGGIKSKPWKAIILYVE